MPDNGPPTVRLRQGTYSGLVLQRQSGGGLARDIEAWRGIPYAQSTAGENRFRPPVPLPPAGENARTIEALRFGQRCPPGDGRAAVPGTYAAGVPSGEDCLNANVYRWARGAIEAWERTEKARRAMGRQRRKAGKGVPVVVYVHGGAFNTGTGVERNMASFIAWADEPMIGINFNYRVGALGFLPSSLTAREGLLNLGLRDQQMLFEWVRDNVAAFGGDPDNVTIMGLSAGAHSVSISHWSSTGPNAP